MKIADEIISNSAGKKGIRFSRVVDVTLSE